MDGSPEPGGLQGRVVRAKEREIAAHRHAIDLHEAAARLFDRQRQPAHAAKARRRAQHARDLLTLALQEKDKHAATTSHPHARGSRGLPPDGTTAAIGGVSEDSESARTDDKPRKGTA